MRLSDQFLRFTPPKIHVDTPEIIHEFMERAGTDDFHMADVIRVKTKVAEFEKRSLDEKIEEQILHRMKELQENAYKEGFAVGKEDGQKEAFEAYSKDLVTKLKAMDASLESMARIKSEMLQASEAHFVKFAIYLAERLAYHTIATKPEALMQLIQKAIEMAQGEEKLVIRLAPEQVEFLDGLRKSSHNQGLEALKKAHLEPDPEIKLGGCVISSNYSEIDARIEERVKMLWELLGDQIIKTDDTMTA